MHSVGVNYRRVKRRERARRRIAEMAAAGEEDVSALDERVNKLNISEENDNAENAAKNDTDNNTTKTCVPRLWGFETRELYKLALNFYKGR